MKKETTKGKRLRKGTNRVNLSVLKNVRGKYYIQIKFSNGRILAHSEDYSSQGEAIDSISSFIVAIQRNQFRLSV